MSEPMVPDCWKCGKPLHDDIPRLFPRREQCRACGCDLHVCRQCRHYAPRLLSRCEHEQSEPPRDAEIANFCEFFVPAAGAYNRGRDSRAEQSRAQLGALFGDSETESDPDPDSQRAAFDDLFKD